MADNDKILKCPACQTEMKKIFVPSRGINIDICVDGCGGIYFDNREFKQFDEKHEDASKIFEALEGKEFKKVDESAPRICPWCRAKMVKNFSSVKREIQVDECYSCGGKFLDCGELEKIRNEYDTEEERSADFSNRLYAIVGEEYENALLSNTQWIANEKRIRRKRFINFMLRIMTFGALGNEKI